MPLVWIGQRQFRLCTECYCWSWHLPRVLLTYVMTRVSFGYKLFFLHALSYFINTAVFRPTTAISRLQLLDFIAFSTLIFLNKVMSKLNRDKKHHSPLLFTIVSYGYFSVIWSGFVTIHLKKQLTCAIFTAILFDTAILCPGYLLLYCIKFIFVGRSNIWWVWHCCGASFVDYYNSIELALAPPLITSLFLQLAILILV